MGLSASVTANSTVLPLSPPLRKGGEEGTLAEAVSHLRRSFLIEALIDREPKREVRAPSG